MNPFSPIRLTPAHVAWPRQINRLPAEAAPSSLWILGNLALLAKPKIALFCSARCPGDAILRAYDQAGHWRDSGRCVISGFHSPMERECLRILLRGNQPIILCPARGLLRRLCPELRAAFGSGRLLLVTPFRENVRRVTAELAVRRNELVAALADEIWFAHITPGGEMERLSKSIVQRSSYPR